MVLAPDLETIPSTPTPWTWLWFYWVLVLPTRTICQGTQEESPFLYLRWQACQTLCSGPWSSALSPLSSHSPRVVLPAQGPKGKHVHMSHLGRSAEFGLLTGLEMAPVLSSGSLYSLSESSSFYPGATGKSHPFFLKRQTCRLPSCPWTLKQPCHLAPAPLNLRLCPVILT